MRKSTIYGLLSARHQRLAGWSFLRNNDGGGGDDGGAGGGNDDDDQGDGGGRSDDDDQGDGGKNDDDNDADKDGDKPKGKTFDEKYVKQLRDEAAASRTQLKSIVDAINQAINPDAKKGEKPDPAKLAEQLTAKDTELREAKVEVAVLRAAAKHGADPVALTDSRDFMRKVNALDPTDDKFGSKVADAIKKAVQENPRFAAPTGSKKSGPPIPNGGGGKQAKPTSLADAYAAHYAGQG